MEGKGSGRPKRIDSLRHKPLQEFGFTFNRDRYGNVESFTDTNGDSFTLGDGEQILFVQKADGTERQVFIRLASGREVPFAEWRKDKLPN